MNRFTKFTKLVSAFLFLLAIGQSGFTTSAPQFNGPGKIRYLIQTGVTNPGQLSQLSHWLQRSRFDVAGMNWHKGTIEVITSQAGVDYLNKKGIKGTVLVSEAAVDPRYLNPQTLEAKLKALNQAFPKLSRLEQIGTSLQGRPIWAFLVSDSPSPTDPRNLEKPTFLFDGQHHAREVMTSEVVVDAAETLLRSAQSNQVTQGIVNRWNIWFIPMINVDGANIVFSRDNMWRKNARGDQESIFGVDINRNYPYRFAGCNGSSNSKGAQDYHGTGGASEPETAAVVKLASMIRPTVSLSYHSYSELVLYPYGCPGEYTPERQLVEKIGRELSEVLPSDDGFGHYAQGTPWEIIYNVDGDSMDFFYASFGTLAYTFEINKAFQPPYSVREPTVLKQRKAWGYLLNRADRNMLHVTVVDGRTQKPQEAFVKVSTINPVKGELPYKTNVGGHYFKVLDPGQYVISAKLADGRVGQVQVQMNGQPQSATLTIP